ncbi:MAG: nitrate reductase subunit beta, partial [Cellulomonas sp.]|nr:nitrate reductase subunit beta [Cellulomonas sp.]
MRAGGRVHKLLSIFANPVLPNIRDYYEPWTYDYETLVDAPLGDDFPVAEPRSLLSGRPMSVEWSANWDDDLGGIPEQGELDPIVERIRRASEDKVRFEYEQAFMFYLPRICEHCLNPTCVAACPSGAMYKRAEDGIVLVDQDRCRGWRMCVSSCPYKKVYFNHTTGKAEKCTLCYPRLEAGQPTICSETCVGRLRYLGVLLYDADRVGEAAAVEDPQDLYPAQRSVLLDPYDPQVVAATRRDGVPESWIQAAQDSPIWALIDTYEVALPLHPEYRTLPMVWYIPPLSPVVDQVTASGNDGEDHKILLTALSTMRIPLEYLAGLFTAGDTRPVERSLRRLAAMRSYMRDVNLGGAGDEDIAGAVGMSGAQVEDMYRLLAIAKYDDRYVIPTTHPETPRGIAALGQDVSDLIGAGDGSPEACSVSTFHGQSTLRMTSRGRAAAAASAAS